MTALDAERSPLWSTSQVNIWYNAAVVDLVVFGCSGAAILQVTAVVHGGFSIVERAQRWRALQTRDVCRVAKCCEVTNRET